MSDIEDVIVDERWTMRGGTAAALASVNEIPYALELVIERDTKKLKLGDGTTPYNGLQYLALGGNRIFSIEGAPQPSLGENGDYAIDANDGDPILWGPRTFAGWGTPLPLRGPPGPSSSAYFAAAFDGGNVDIVPGAYCDVIVPYGFDMTRVSMIAGGVGNIAVDVRVVPFEQYPPLASDSIVGDNPPAINGNDKWTDTALTGWRKTVAERSTIRFQVLSCSGLTRAQILIEGIRS